MLSPRAQQHIQSDHNCPHCGHPGSRHFTNTDAIGYWAFCTVGTCDCFIDDSKRTKDQRSE